jgi:hypothetical protein
VELKGWQGRKLSLEQGFKKGAASAALFLSAGTSKSNGTIAY